MKCEAWVLEICQIRPGVQKTISGPAIIIVLFSIFSLQDEAHSIKIKLVAADLFLSPNITHISLFYWPIPSHSHSLKGLMFSQNWQCLRSAERLKTILILAENDMIQKLILIGSCIRFFKSNLLCRWEILGFSETWSRLRKSCRLPFQLESAVWGWVYIRVPWIVQTTSACV